MNLKKIKNKIFGITENSSNTEQSGISSNTLLEKFNSFAIVLDCNNNALKIISDIEEKSGGDFIFDINYIKNVVADLNNNLNLLVENMILLGGDKYLKIRHQYETIRDEINVSLSGIGFIPESPLTISFDELDKTKACSVGSKNAQLGELRNNLGIPIPDGFAISAYAYKHFIDYNNLQSQINQIISQVNIRDYNGLEKISSQINSLLLSGTIPNDLADDILKSYESLTKNKSMKLVSLRSSALGEDTRLSFAGQYSTFLGVRQEEILESYKKVIAGKFSPKAIYYFLSHELSESNLAMSVGCVSMLDARSAGVMYSSNPVQVSYENDFVIINSVYGLGKLLVDGSVTPDSFNVSKESQKIVQKIIAKKSKQLLLKNDGGTSLTNLPDDFAELPSLSDDEILRLFEIARKIERHYGSPQDIEWAIDKSGELFILQTRPLRIIKQLSSMEVDTTDIEIVAKGGTVACPGAASGSIFHIKSIHDLINLPDNCVIVTENPFPGLITALNKASAIITKIGGVASHMVTIAREYAIPTIVGFENTEFLMQNESVTIDATNCIIYKGVHSKIVEALKPVNNYNDEYVFELLKKISTKIIPLNLINSSFSDSDIVHASTIHDILRYAHQKSMEEMFSGATVSRKNSISYHLKSDIPLPVDIISIDDEPVADKKKRINDNEVRSIPFKAFWDGILKEGWTTPPAPPDIKSFLSVMATDASAARKQDFSEKSYAVISKEYMVFNIRLGYHYSTLEAMCTPVVSKNFIRLRFKEGGASFERRIMRIRLISGILAQAGFECSSKGDFLDAFLNYQTDETVKNRLYLLGRLTMLTKQLDMALSDDDEFSKYQNNIKEKLQL